MTNPKQRKWRRIIKGKVVISIENWCKLTDALHIMPENSIDRVIHKVEVLQQTKTDLMYQVAMRRLGLDDFKTI